MKYAITSIVLSLVLAGCALEATDSAPEGAEEVGTAEQALCGDDFKAFGYAWVNNPSAGFSIPLAAYSHNSSGGAVNVTRNALGDHTVKFLGLGGAGAARGTVHVTAYGWNGEACKVRNWFPNPADIEARVLCFNGAGGAADVRFNVSFSTHPSEVTAHTYLWANDPIAAAYVPNLDYQYNSTCANDSIQRTGIGAYKAKLPGMADGHQGTVKVTAYGPSSDQCKVFDWWTAGADVEVDVRCRTAAGVVNDGQFTLTYTRKNNLFGEGAGTRGYVYVDWVPSAPLARQFNSTGAVNNVVRTGPVGQYQVKFPGLAVPGGHVQVVAAGQTATRCQVSGWGPNGADTLVDVTCHSAVNTLTDAPFTVSFWSR